MSIKIAIRPDCWDDCEQALQMAERLGLPLVSNSEQAELLLVRQDQRLQICTTGKRTPGPVSVDFIAGKSAHRRRFGGGRGQPLARAIGLKKEGVRTVIDATAGLGSDAFVLAALGCEIILIERSRVIAALLEDGLQRALDDEDTGEVVSRMHLIQGDAMQLLGELSPPDVVYLDPMYPKSGSRAQVKKEMQLFRQLLGPDLDSEQLLDAGLSRALKRVVVKRPAKAPPIAGRSPSAHISSPNTRYDLYFCNA